MAKAPLNMKKKKKSLFTRKLDLILRKNAVKWYIWSTALYGAEIWTLRKVDQKYLGSFGMWCWRRTEKISCTIVWRFRKSWGVEECAAYSKKEEMLTVLVTSSVGTAFWNGFFNPLNRSGDCFIYRTSSYCAVNTFHVGYKKQSVYTVSGTSRWLFSDKYKTHRYSVGRTYSCWTLNCWCITWPVGFKRLTV